MSSFKKILKGAFARAVGQPIVVRSTRSLSPHLVRVRFEGDSLRAARWTPGDKIKLHAGGVLRSYTPARIDPACGAMDIVFHLHGKGPAARWAASLQTGEEASFLGPAPSMRSSTKNPSWAMFLGDETTLGLAEALLHALPTGTPVTGALELELSDASSIQAAQLPLTAAVRTSEESRGQPLLDWLNRHELPQESGGIVWLSGEASSVLRVRNALRERGLERPQVCIKAYWSVRGNAHRKQLERDLAS